jgi:hypothetical protein
MDAKRTSRRERIASLSISAALAVLLLAIGASLYEHLVVDRAWPDNPSLIQPALGGLDRKTLWIPLHISTELLLLIALYTAWPRRPIRRLVIAAALLHLAMRIWTFVYFIPHALRFESPHAPPDGATTWVTLSILRFPLVLAAAVLLALASRRLGSASKSGSENPSAPPA